MQEACTSFWINPALGVRKMGEETTSQEAQKQPSAILPTIEKLSIPSIADSLKDVYKAGSIPLVLIFVAATVIFVLLVQGVLQTLSWLIYLVGGLLASGVALFAVMSWIGYRQWRDELQARVDNRRTEMDLYIRLWTSNSDLQDKFLLSLMKSVGELVAKFDTAESHEKAIKGLIDPLSTLIRDITKVRSEIQLPEFTPIFGVKETHEK